MMHMLNKVLEVNPDTDAFITDKIKKIEVCKIIVGNFACETIIRLEIQAKRFNIHYSSCKPSLFGFVYLCGLNFIFPKQ